jgi:hypothetical protein
MSAPSLIHQLLLRLQCEPQQATELPAMIEIWRQAAPWSLEPARLAYSSESRWAYAYMPLAEPQALAREAVLGLAAGLPIGTNISRLQQVFEAPGQSSAQTPLHHYVVETDPAAGWFEEISQWYDQEHMPGLALVPGCTLAQRFLNLDAGPLSHACYGLLSEDVLGCPPWLAVRATDWSSRCRPHFTNTRRTMLRLLPG